MLAAPSTPWAGTARKFGRLVATYLASLTWVNVKSAGPTTAQEQVLLPPCFCAHGWLASPARNRSSTHTEMEPPRIKRGEDGLKGLGGTEASSYFQKLENGSNSYNANEMKSNGIRNII